MATAILLFMTMSLIFLSFLFFSLNSRINRIMNHSLKLMITPYILLFLTVSV